LLLKRGDKVICVDNFNDFYDPKVKRQNIAAHKNNKNFVLYSKDIGDYKAVEKIIAKEKPDKILHLAARAGVQPSLKNPLEYVRSNVAGTANLLEACRKHGIRNFVMASSSSVYGGNKKVPFSEEDRVDNPYSPYAATKKSCEVIASNYHHITGMHIIALRYFTVYGPRNRPDMAIYKFAESIMQEKEITLYGKGDEIKRDWTFVADIVDGTIKALDNVEKFKFEIINLGNSHPVSVAYFVSVLEKSLGKKAKTKRAQLPVGDVPITYADTSKAKRLLEWQPTTPIEKGVPKFAKWFKQHTGL
jgi:UDP-glucuronate 4-epimerase